MAVTTRYEHHEHGGASVWVLCMNRFHFHPGDIYTDEWLCVWSTEGGRPGQRVPAIDTGFVQLTRPGPDIPLPLVGDALARQQELHTAARDAQFEVGNGVNGQPDPLTAEVKT